MKLKGFMLSVILRIAGKTQILDDHVQIQSIRKNKQNMGEIKNRRDTVKRTKNWGGQRAWGNGLEIMGEECWHSSSGCGTVAF